LIRLISETEQKAGETLLSQLTISLDQLEATIKESPAESTSTRSMDRLLRAIEVVLKLRMDWIDVS